MVHTQNYSEYNPYWRRQTFFLLGYTCIAYQESNNFQYHTGIPTPPPLRRLSRGSLVLENRYRQILCFRKSSMSFHQNSRPQHNV